MGGGGEDLHLGGQEDGIAMKGAQSKVKWVANGAHGVNGEGGGGLWPPRPPIVTPLLHGTYSGHIIFLNNCS